jgi:hypothetical protein
MSKKFVVRVIYKKNTVTHIDLFLKKN